MLETPIVFIIFNRPELTLKVFNTCIKKVKPKTLYVVADGPRNENSEDGRLTAETRKIIENNINWKCTLQTLYRKENLGCGLSIKEGLDWVFQKEKKAIILEDDVIVDLSFFIFCDELLTLYENDSRIMNISARNIFQTWNPDKYNYFFSYHLQVWGWATWQRAWRKNDFYMKDWPKSRSIIKRNLGTLDSYKLYKTLFSQMYKNIRKQNYHTWDYQWLYSCMKEGGLSISPSRNLSINIGRGIGAHGNYSEEVIPDTVTLSSITSPLIINHDIKVDQDFDQKYSKFMIQDIKTKPFHKLIITVKIVKRIIQKYLCENKG